MKKEFDIYLAAGIFNEEQINVCKQVENLCESNHLKYFAPRIKCEKPGKQLVKLNEKIRKINIDDLSNEKDELLEKRDKVATKILKINEKGIQQSKILLARIDNHDFGTSIEMGIAFAKNIPVVSYSTLNFGSNVMASQKVIAHAKNMQQLEEIIIRLKRDGVFEYNKYTAKDIKEMRFAYYKLNDSNID